MLQRNDVSEECKLRLLLIFVITQEVCVCVCVCMCVCVCSLDTHIHSSWVMTHTHTQHTQGVEQKDIDRLILAAALKDPYAAKKAVSSLVHLQVYFFFKKKPLNPRP